MRVLKNPLARKRWQRFRRRRRAFVSLIGLLLLCVVGALANLLCNERPWYVRFEGRHYFPVIHDYPETTFTGNGLLTRPRYRELSRTSAFAPETGNVMIFAPVPYGPRESLDPAELRQEETVTLTLMPTPYVGSVNVDRELTVVHATAAGHFFGVPDADVVGRKLDSAWPVSDEMAETISRRFTNREAPAWRGEETRRPGNPMSATLRLSRFSPRRQAPATVRIRLSTMVDPDADSACIVFARDGTPRPDTTFPEGVTDDVRQTLEALAKTHADVGTTSPNIIAIRGTRYRAVAETDVVRWPYRPVRGHWMGIDAAGHDVLSRIIHGLRISLAFGLLLALVAVLVGSTMGAIQGYFGGVVDIGGQRLIEIWSALPFLYIMILMGSVFGRSFTLLLLCYGLFNWIGISYYMRAEFLRLRHEPFVESAKCLGIPTRKIIWRHVMPNALTPLITMFPFLLVGAISSLAALDFLGFGLPPLTPSWGELLRQAQQHSGAWWLIVYPFMALFVVMILSVFVGEGVRDAYDPRPLIALE